MIDDFPPRFVGVGSVGIIIIPPVFFPEVIREYVADENTVDLEKVAIVPSGCDRKVSEQA